MKPRRLPRACDRWREPGVPAPPENLRELQRAFGAALLDGLRPIDAPGVAVSTGVVAGLAPEAFEIYRQTCRGALTGALATSFPAVRKLVGESFFEGCACAFIAEHPPAGACLNDYGGDFPAFLRGYGPAAAIGYLADVAALEHAFNRALHAADAAPADIAALGSLTPAEAASLRLVPHPAIAVLRLDSPADRIWRAVLDDDAAAMAGIDLSADPVWLLIERRPDGVEVRRMSAGAARFTQRLIDGQPLGRALAGETAEAAGTAEPLEALLADHLASSRFIAWRVTPAATDTGESLP